MTASTIAEAAFGAEPARWPLPAAADPTQRWLRAVAAGGQGRYSSAMAELDELARSSPPVLASLAFSTRGSLVRQQGWHARARRWDGQALACAGGDPQADLDALTGLAADALGLGRLAVSAALLERAEDVHRRCGDALPARTPVRLAWVRAELAMASGEGAAAVEHARRAVDLVGATMPTGYRHQVKSQTVLAAAMCCDGDLPAARRTADAALDGAGEFGLQPLRWALARLLSDIGSVAHQAAAVAAIRTESAAFLTRHGARLRDR